MERQLNAEQAVALLYDAKRNSAPKVVASGRGALAKKILSRAREAGVPIQEDPELVEILGKIPIGSEIPAELYQAVAEILAFVYRLGKRGENTPDQGS